MVKIKRQTVNTYCVIDYSYKDESLIGTQGNLMGNNRYNAKSYIYGRQIFEDVNWERLKN
jgi:hypothetical protein